MSSAPPGGIRRGPYPKENIVTDRPYTDADLRAEAARQHRNLAEDPDFGGVGEQMTGTAIPSRASERCGWHDLDDLPGDAFGDAQRAIHDLIAQAADTSAWAVGLGADRLEPWEAGVDVTAFGDPVARVHVAFEPGLPAKARAAFVERLRLLLAEL